MSRKYRVEQQFTDGWNIVDKDAIKLSKDEARKWLETDSYTHLTLPTICSV